MPILTIIKTLKLVGVFCLRQPRIPLCQQFRTSPPLTHFYGRPGILPLPSLNRICKKYYGMPNSLLPENLKLLKIVII